mmetsp:Transcript_13366/g.21905  ORF Transcript_13366/g.21905 Transcript_13366/m.21905 type:complete len:445 (+) Transcript_13366:32-1366(+)
MLMYLLFTVLFLSTALAQVIDLDTDEAFEGTFLESGFVTLTPFETVNITTTNVFTNPIVFLSTVFASNGYSDNIPVEPRIVELIDTEGAEENVYFSLTLIWPSNKTCVSEWTDGSSPQGTYTVGWYVGEEGGYSVSGVQMEFAKASVNAVAWNLANWRHNFGTDCNYPSQDDDDDHSPGAIFTIQSDNNAGQYLTVRSSSWFKNERTKCDYAWAGGYMRLYPHDFDKEAGLIDINEIRDEDVGVFLFDIRHPRTLDCFAGNYIEMSITSAFSSDSFRFDMYNAIDTSTTQFGVFGSALTLEGGDSMMIKSYSQHKHPKRVYSFIQEDSCVDEETIHYPETLSYILSYPSTIDCNGIQPIVGDHTFAPSHAPTSSPTHAPTKEGEEVVEGSGKTSSDDSGVLLAVFLPICIIILVAVVGMVTKKVFLSPPAADSSEHSGLNLMPA